MAISSFKRSGLARVVATIPGDADFSNSATGTYSSGTINYKYITFTANGTLTVTKAGLADVLVVGGGGGGSSGFGSGGGGGGGVAISLVELTVGTHNVTVGSGGAANVSAFSQGGAGGLSELVGFAKIGGGMGGATTSTSTGLILDAIGGGGSGGGGRCASGSGNVNGAGAGGTVFGSNEYDGRSLSITGTSYEYGPGGRSGVPSNYGRGGFGNQAGLAGVVIVRVRTN